MDIFKVEILGETPLTINFGEPIETNNSNIINTSQKIHLDDTIQTIKNKILVALNFSIAYEELYLFVRKPKYLSKIDIFNSILDEYEDLVDLEKVKLFLKNFDESVSLEEKEYYSYEDFYNLPDQTIVNGLLGHKFKEPNYLFSINPFNCTKEIQEDVFICDDSVLLNFANTNTIYLCLAEEVYKNTQVTKEYLTKMYFPYLYKNDIFNETHLFVKRAELIENNKNNIPSELLKLYEMVDLFYEISDTIDDFEYNRVGIKSFQLQISSLNNNILPLDSIFKNIHATKQMPFIKFNPGLKRETMYRLYSEKFSRTGEKIPYLPSSEILKYAKDLGKAEEIVIIVKNDNMNYPMDLNIFIKKNGNVLIECVFLNDILESNVEISIENMRNVLLFQVNPIIHLINYYLENIGYHLKNFASLDDDNIQINKIQYVSSLKITKKMNFDKYKVFLSSMFSFLVQDLKKSNINMNFKRVENYTEMDPQDEYIIEELKGTDDIMEIVNGLMQEFSLTREQAESKYAKFVSNYTSLNGEIIENTGFPFQIYLDKTTNIVNLEMNNINSHHYLPLVYNYFKSIIGLFEESHNIKHIIKKIDNLCKKEIDFDIIEEVRVEKIVAPVEFQEIQSEYFVSEEQEQIFGADDEEESSSKPIFGFDDDEEEEEDEVEGGNGDELEKDLAGMRLKHPNPIQLRIEERDPDLILKQEKGKFKQYSRVCPANDKRQPIILNDKEMEEINKNPESYTTAIKYGSKKSKEHWYICPRYWDLKTNNSLSENQVKEILKKNKNAIIPNDADVVKEGQHILQFANPKQHFDDNKNYVPHYPGLMDPSKHPDGLRIPCCFKTENKGIREKKEQPKTTNYVVDASKFPIPDERLGFLPLSVQKFFNTDNKSCVSKANNAMIKPNTECFVRYGVEQTMLQSLIGCFADIYSYVNNKPKPLISEMMEIIIDAIDLDKFLEYQNASFVAIFKPSQYVNIETSKYQDTVFYKSLDLNDKNEYLFLLETIASYENFLSFLQDPKGIKDHNYFWSIMTQPNNKLIASGMNMAILEITKDDDYLELICPTNPYQRHMFYEDRGTFILLKQNEYYEPVYLYEQTNKGTRYEKLFYKSSKNKSIKYVLNNIKTKYNKFCSPKKSLPGNYLFEKPKSLIETCEILEKYNIKIEYEVMNYQAKIIGLFVTVDKMSIFLPCFPSSQYKYDIASIEDPILWNNYKNTINGLNKIHKKTKKEIKCLPMKKVFDDGNTIGVLTETNQYVKLSEPEDGIDDDLEITYSADYIDADINTSFNEIDNQRIGITKSILLESQYYNIFRTTVRILMTNPIYRNTKTNILKVLSDIESSYENNIRKIYYILQDLGKKYIVFDDIEEEIAVSDITTCFNDCNKKSCKKHKNECVLVVPKKNLTNDRLYNEILYYTRLSDELLRFQRIRSFILEPNKYLNLTNLEYKVDDNEILLIDSFVKSDYFNQLKLFNSGDTEQKISYEIAQPDIRFSQVYSNKDEI